MIIDGFNKLTLLDYPQTLACIIFTRGCNFACPYCHNSSLIKCKSDEGLVKRNEVISYLKSRKDILEGIVVSGGEPTIQPGLKDLLIEIKDIGYKIKLDTNGTNPKVLKELLELNLLDYVAMDIKNTFAKYEDTVESRVNIEDIKLSMEILKASDIDYEFRTTIIKEFHTTQDIEELIKITQGSNYYIQNFKDSDSVLKSGLHGFSKDELDLIKKKHKEIKVR